MLTISTIKNSKGAADYFTKEDNYYLSEVDAKNASLWWGKGASELKLSGKKVEKQSLQDIFRGELPNGVTVGFLQKDGKIKHRAGYDLCFHAPKSVSILALDGGDKRFYEVHLEAVKETLKIIERDCAQSRVYKDGRSRFENTKNLTVALIRHTASREQDPHLHHHALVMNVTKRSDNKWRSLASSMTKSNGEVNGFFERIHKNQIYYGLIYKNSLANKVLDLGCEIEVVGNHGMWEIKGVPKEARNIMSKRRKQIEDRIKNLNYPSLKAADVASLDTREKKSKNIKLEDMQQIWKNELASVGFSSEKFITELEKNFERNFRRDLKDAEERRSVDVGVKKNWNVGNEKNEENLKNAKEVIKDAIEDLSQYNLKLDYAKIAAKALELSIGNSTHSDIIRSLNEAIIDGTLIPIDKSDSIFVTKKLTETENKIRDFIERGKNASSAINLKIKTRVEALDNIDRKDSIKDNIKGNPKNDIEDAKNVGIAVLSSKDRFSLVEIRNTGNILSDFSNNRMPNNRNNISNDISSHLSNYLSNSTEFISTVLDLAESSGKTVRILSPNRMMANEINENIRRKPNNLWRWLLSLGKPELGESVAGFKYRYKLEADLPLLKLRKGKDVVIVNDVGTLGSNDLYSLLELTEKTDAKVIFLRDLNNSRKGFAPGNSIETLKQAGIETFTIGANEQDQREKRGKGEKEGKEEDAGKRLEGVAKELKNAINTPDKSETLSTRSTKSIASAISAAKVPNYIPELKEVKDNEERIGKLAKAYVLSENDVKDRGHTVVLLGSKAQLRSANEAIRNELKDKGRLLDMEHNVSVLTPVYMSKPEVTLAHKYQKNMIIRFYDTKHVGKDWKVESIDREKNILRLVRDGKDGYEDKKNKDVEEKDKSIESKSIKGNIRNSIKKSIRKSVREILGKKRILWNPKKQEIDHKVYQKINHAVFKREEIQIAKGDKLIATSNMRLLGIKSATEFIVQDINENHVKLVRLGPDIKEVKGSSKSNKVKEIKVRLSHLKDSHFQYDYATTVGRYSRKKVDHILADIKAYSLDKATIDELISYAQKSLTIFTNDADIAQRRFGHVPLRLTAAETLLYASKGIEVAGDVKNDIKNNFQNNIKDNFSYDFQDNFQKNVQGAVDGGGVYVDRYINDKTVSEIRLDIEKAIAVLKNQYDIRNRAENKAVEFALEKITSRNAGFTHKDLVKEALEYALVEQMAVQNRKIAREDIEKVIKEKRESGELIMGRYFEDGTRWTTKKIREQELSIVENVEKGKDRLNPLVEQEIVERFLGPKSAGLKSEKDEINEINRVNKINKKSKISKRSKMSKISKRSERTEVNKQVNEQNEISKIDKGNIGVEEIKLTQDQKNACHLIITTKDQFVMVQGDASTGKTTMFGYVQKMLKEASRENEKGSVEILALAPTHQAVKELKSKGLETQTFKSFLVEWNRIKKNGSISPENISSNTDHVASNNTIIPLVYTDDGDGSKMRSAPVSLNDLNNKLIILDEASMISNEDFLQFLDIVINTKSHVVLGGDIKQHLPIGCGKIFEMLVESKVLQVVYLSENVRQKNQNLKAALKDIINKSFDSALEKIAKEDQQKYIERIDVDLLNAEQSKGLNKKERLNEKLNEKLTIEPDKNLDEKQDTVLDRRSNETLETVKETINGVTEGIIEGAIKEVKEIGKAEKTKETKKAEEIKEITETGGNKLQGKSNLSINPLSVEFFNSSRCSIVERDDNELKKGESSLKEMLAEDFLTRIPETRNNTIVIVHAHKDRKDINGFIRKGLKEQGYIARKGILVNRLVSKGLTDAEHKFTQSYRADDVVKLGKEYYHVIESDKLSKSLLLKSEAGETKYFYPEKYTNRYNLELYKRTSEELATGDTIRLTKTDKERGLYAGFEYIVKEINNDLVILESKDIDGIKYNHMGSQKSRETKEIQKEMQKETQQESQKEPEDLEVQKKQKTQIILNTKELRDTHWDYAYTVTGYSIQGGSKKYVIDFEVSYRKELANQRSFYIGSSRAIDHLMVYTDSRDKFLRRIFKNKGNKYAALEVTGELSNKLDDSKLNSGANGAKYGSYVSIDGRNGEVIRSKGKQSKNKYQQHLYNTKNYDIKEIGRLLGNSAESFIERLLGRPNERLSSSTEWRYGNKGSLSIRMSGDRRGQWKNFETGDSGDLLTLLQRETRLSFRESLKYAMEMFGREVDIGVLKQNETARLKSEASSVDLNVSKDEPCNRDKNYNDTGEGRETSKTYKTDKINSINKNSKNKTGEYAQKLVSESVPVTGTVVERYLKKVRGINNIDSPDIRYHPSVYIGRNKAIEKQKYMPAMLSIGRDKNNNVQCVQVTYLDPKTACKADLDVKKRTYASPTGALVSLRKQKYQEEYLNGKDGEMDKKNKVDDSIIDYRNNKNNESSEINKRNKNNRISFIAEGVETGLSIKDAVGTIKNADVLVTLGKSNFANIDPKNIGQRIVFCLDNDGPELFTDKTIHKAAQRLIGFGKDVFVTIPNQEDSMNGTKIKMDNVKNAENIESIKDIKGMKDTKNIKIDFNDVARTQGLVAVRQYMNNAIPYEQFSKEFMFEDRKVSRDTTDKTVDKNNLTKDVVKETQEHIQPQIEKRLELDLEI